MSSFFRHLRAAARDGLDTFQQWSWVKKVALVVALAAVGLAALFIDAPGLATLQQWALHTGRWFPILFVAVYVLITQFPIPRTVMTLSAGVLFGPKLGIVLALLATTISAALSLSVVRGLFRDWIAPKLTHPAVERINARLRARGWLAVTSLRMIAAVPFSIMNYAAALTAVPLWGFTLATFVGSAPGTVITVVLGDSFTHGTNLPVLLAVAGLAVLGIFGLVLDARLPVKAER